MTKYLFVILALLMFVAMPVSAEYIITAEPVAIDRHTFWSTSNLTYDASLDGDGIQRVMIDAPIGTILGYTLYYSNGTYVSGSCQFNEATDPLLGWGWVTSYVSLGGGYKEYTYYSNTGVGRVYIQGYAKNETSEGVFQKGFIVAGSTGGITTWGNEKFSDVFFENEDVIFFPVTSPGDGVIYKIVIDSNQPLTAIDVFTNDRNAVANAVSQSWLDMAWQWINFGLKIGQSVLNFATQVYSGLMWLVLNWQLILALYIGITGAYAFNGTGNIFAKLKRFFKMQVAFYGFVLGLWESFMNLIAQFRSIFKI